MMRRASGRGRRSKSRRRHHQSPRAAHPSPIPPGEGGLGGVNQWNHRPKPTNRHHKQTPHRSNSGPGGLWARPPHTRTPTSVITLLLRSRRCTAIPVSR